MEIVGGEFNVGKVLVETGVAEVDRLMEGVKRGRVKDLICSMLIKVYVSTCFISTIDCH